MRKMYHLAHCSTCQAIIEETRAEMQGLEMQDIKTEPLSSKQLLELKKMAGSYEALFSRRAMKYKEMSLKDQQLEEADYRNLILQEYTFLKRPVTILEGRIFIGNDKKTVTALKEALGK